MSEREYPRVTSHGAHNVTPVPRDYPGATPEQILRPMLPAGVQLSSSRPGELTVKVEATVRHSEFGTGPQPSVEMALRSPSETPSGTKTRKLRPYPLGYTPGPGEPSLADREIIAQQGLTAAEAAPFPSRTPPRYDLRSVGGKNFITHVKDQYHCGSCVAFGVVAAVEGTLRVRRNDPNLNVDFSEAHLFFCLGGKHGRTCGNYIHGPTQPPEPNGGWYPDGALDEFMITGVVDTNCFPYPDVLRVEPQAPTPACQPCPDWASRVTKITNSGILTDHGQMKAYIAGSRGPLVACFTVYDDFQSFFYYHPIGIYHRTAGSQPLGGHCICIVGYNDNDGYWICKNSWGPTFADQGFFKIGYGEAGVDSYMWYADIS